MGTRHLWLALLLALLQYAAVPVDGSDCAPCSTPLDKFACAVADGCTEGSPFKDSKDTDTQCDRKECIAGEHLIADVATPGISIKHLVCSANGKEWHTDTGAKLTDNKAACVKKIACTKWESLTVTCDRIHQNFGCVPFTPSDAEATACPGAAQKMFYKKAESSVWEIAPSGKMLECKTGTGIWDIGGTNLFTGDRVICATSKPGECNKADLTYSCTIGVKNTNAGCKEILSGDLQMDAPLACTDAVAPTQYYYDGTVWKEATVQCNKGTGKWKAGGTTELATGTQVVCAKQNPGWMPCKLSQLKLTACTTDTSINTASGCKPAKQSSPSDDITCPDDAPDTYYKLQDASAVWTKATIQCTKTSGKWDAGGGPLADTTNVICAKTSPNWENCDSLLTSDCLADPDIKNDNAKNSCEVATFKIDGSVVPCSGEKHLYYKKPSEAWKEVQAIKCDRTVGKWDIVGTTNIVTEISKAVCAEANPNPLCGPLSGCLGISECDPVTISAEGLTSCTTAPKTLFYKPDASWEPVVNVHCDTDIGKWKQGANNDPLVGNSVICAVGDPKPKSCPALKYDCPIRDPVVACEPPTGNPMACPATGNTKLYFKKATVLKYQEAKTVTCNSSVLWNLEYNYGNTLKTEMLEEGDSVICAASNPDPTVCLMVDSVTKGAKEKLTIEFFPPTTKTFEAGKPGKCDDPRHDYMVASIAGEPNTYLINSRPPVCDPDGTWYSYGDKFGDKVACALRKCKKCNAKPEGLVLPDGVSIAGFDNPIIFTAAGDECTKVACENDKYTFVVKITDSEKYFSKEMTCLDSDNRYQITVVSSDNLGAKVEEVRDVQVAQCSQKAYCLADTFPQIKYNCPTGSDAIAGCQDAISSIDGGADPNIHNALKCPENTKMFTKKDSVDCFFEVETNPIKCDELIGQWDVNQVDQYGAKSKQSLNHLHTIICAPANPKECVKTTTTTTTPAPILPICDECNSTMPKPIVCEKCDGVHIKLTTYNEECTMTAVGGHQLIINSMEEVDALECKRGTHRWTKKGGTETVQAFAAREEQKSSKLKAASYAIIAAVFISIGGMAIGCVMIYLKMRKQPSERENKKKERGITKKYNGTTNVMKTGGKSGKKSSAKSDGNEAGTSKETPSKADDKIEDAPTLKL